MPRLELSLLVATLLAVSPGLTSSRGGGDTHSGAELLAESKVSCATCAERTGGPLDPQDKHKFYSAAEQEEQAYSSASTEDEAMPVAHSDEHDAPIAHRAAGGLTSRFRGIGEEGDIWWTVGPKDCEKANSCHSNEMIGACNNYHVGCGVSEEAQEQFQLAVYAPSVVRTAQLAITVPDRVRAVPERGVLQILDCKGAVLAQVRASETVVAQISRHAVKKNA